MPITLKTYFAWKLIRSENERNETQLLCRFHSLASRITISSYCRTYSLFIWKTMKLNVTNTQIYTRRRSHMEIRTPYSLTASTNLTIAHTIWYSRFSYLFFLFARKKWFVPEASSLDLVATKIFRLSSCVSRAHVLQCETLLWGAKRVISKCIIFLHDIRMHAEHEVVISIAEHKRKHMHRQTLNTCRKGNEWKVSCARWIGTPSHSSWCFLLFLW